MPWESALCPGRRFYGLEGGLSVLRPRRRSILYALGGGSLLYALGGFLFSTPWESALCHGSQLYALRVGSLLYDLGCSHGAQTPSLSLSAPRPISSETISQ